MSYFKPCVFSTLGNVVRSAPSAPIWIPCRMVVSPRAGVAASPPAPRTAIDRDESHKLRRVIRGAVISALRIHYLHLLRARSQPPNQGRPAGHSMLERAETPLWALRNALALRLRAA